MRRAIQEGVHDPEALAGLKAALDRRGIPRTSVFLGADRRLSCGEWPEADVFAYGSHGLAKLAKERGWNPGSFLDGTAATGTGRPAGRA